MGRKLTSSEKFERADDMEHDRERRARQTERRRQQARQEREEEFNESYENSFQLVLEWQEFYKSVTNLQAITVNYLKPYNTIFDWLSKVVPEHVPPFSRQSVTNIKKEYTTDSSIYSYGFADFKRESEYTLDQFCSISKKVYIPILDLLIGTKRQYANFISQRKSIVEIEEKRKNEYLKTLKEYENKIEEIKRQTEQEELAIRKRYDVFAKELQIRINLTKQTVNSIKQDYDDLSKPVFYQVLLSRLPLNFSIPEWKDYGKTHPSVFEVGISRTSSSNSNSLNVYVLMPEIHFPVQDKQLVLLKETHSERPLTKLQHQEIESNFYSSLVISYAHYFFKFTAQDILNIHLIVNGTDPSTGQSTNILFSGYRIDRDTFSKFNLEKLVPSEAIKKFEPIKSIIKDEILWTHLNYPEFFSSELDSFLSEDAAVFPNEYFSDEETASTDEQLVKPDRDSLFEEAAHLVVEHQQGSASLIQRELNLGYNRAGRLIDQLEAAGIVGPFDGTAHREVLIKDLDALLLVNNHKSLPKVLDGNSGGLSLLKEKLEKSKLPNKIPSVDGHEPEFIKKIRQENPKEGDAWAEWNDNMNKVLLKAKSNLEKRGLDTTDVDNALKTLK